MRFIRLYNDDWDAGERTPNLVQAVGFNLVLGGRSLTLAQQPVVNRDYVAGTGITSALSKNWNERR